MRLITLSALFLAGCATQLSDAGSKVRVVTEQQRPACQFVQHVAGNAELGPDKPGSALRDALNKTAAAGGNGLFIVTNAVHWFDGASVSGEALRCPA